MSYRGVKRVLGETRLELQCLLLFAVCLLTLVGGSFWWYGGKAEDLVYRNASSTGQDLVHSIMLQKHWEFLDAEKFRKVNESISRNFQTLDFEAACLKPNSKVAQSQPKNDYEVWILQHFPASIPPEQNAAGAEPEETARGKKPKVQFVDRHIPDENGSYIYEYYQPVYAKKSAGCLSCHYSVDGAVTLGAPEIATNDVPLQDGDLMAVVKVTMPDSETQD